MTDDPLKNALKDHDALHRQLKPLSTRVEALQGDFSKLHVIDVADPIGKVMRAVLGPVEDLRSSRLLDTVPNVASDLQSVGKLGMALGEQFRLPQLPEIPTLLESFDIEQWSFPTARILETVTELNRSIEAMTTPWLNVQDESRSLTGLMGLQDMGLALASKPMNEMASGEQWRRHLGDYRPPIDWPPQIFTDPVARSDFYVGRGLDSTLTDFPAPAFDQATTITGIKRPPPPRIEAYCPAGERDEQEAGFQRNNAAHDRLQRFETHMRAFVDRQMTAACGKNWTKSRVPGPVWRRWRENREKARARGEPELPLIAYADFTDYEVVIVRKDNWNEVFAPVFGRKTLVQESFQRLYPIRVCTMHARIITQDDELYLFTETRLLLKAISQKT